MKEISTRHEDETKNNTVGVRYCNAATMVRHYVYDHLTGSGAQSLKCLLPIFDHLRGQQNPFRMIFLNTQVRSLLLCVNIDLVGLCAFA